MGAHHSYDSYTKLDLLGGERDELTNAEAPHDYQRMLSKCFASEYDEVAQTYYEIMDSPDSDQAIDEFVAQRRGYVDSIAAVSAVAEFFEGRCHLCLVCSGHI